MYPRGRVRPRRDEAADPSSTVEGLSLPGYVEVCRALIRTAGGSSRRIEEVLAAHGLTPEQWELVREGWSERIRRHPRVRFEFQLLYVRPGEVAGGNE
jgi:hypothetical protein